MNYNGGTQHQAQLKRMMAIIIICGEQQQQPKTTSYYDCGGAKIIIIIIRISRSFFCVHSGSDYIVASGVANF